MLLLLTLAQAFALPTIRIELDVGRDSQIQFERHMDFDGQRCSTHYRVTRDGTTTIEEGDSVGTHCEAIRREPVTTGPARSFVVEKRDIGQPGGSYESHFISRSLLFVTGLRGPESLRPQH